MKNKPLLSIIVPVYHVEEYLPQCVESILHQDYEDYEVLLIDDGGDDACPRLCDEYAIKDNRIKVIHQQNGGLGQARNAGIRIANGEWILFVDSDDYLEPGALREVAKATESYPEDKLFVFRYVVEKEGQKQEAPLQPFVEGVQSTEDYKGLIRRYSDTAGWAVWKLAIHRSLICDDKQLLFLPEVRRGEDLYWVYRLFNRVSSIRYVDRIIYVYRVCRGESLSSEDPQNAVKWLTDLEITFKWFMENPEEDVVSIIRQNLAATYLGYMYCSATKQTEKEWTMHIEWMRNIIRYFKCENCGKKRRLIWMSLRVLPEKRWFGAMRTIRLLLG